MMPATYNLEYYRGDTLTFYVNVKDSSGVPIDLSGFAIAFVIATARGDNPPDPGNGIPTVTCTASVSGSQITCVITPTQGNNLLAGTPYVYDVQATLGGQVSTYLTGSINVTDDVA